METYIPKNIINTPLQLTEDELVQKLQEYKKDNARLRQNNETYKLQYIEMREKLYKLLELTKI
jgi:cell shape-determining protein MreC